MVTGNDRSEDKHLGHGYFIRLDGADETRFQAYLKRAGLAGGRVIKQVLLEFLDRNEHSGNEEENPR